MKLYISTLLLLSILFFACDPSPKKQPAPKEKTFANYYVRFLAAENQLKAEATFRSGESSKNSKPMKIDGGVIFQSKPMTEQDIDKLNIVRYNFTTKAQYNSKYNFFHIGKNSQEQRQILSMSPIDEFLVSGILSKSQGMTLAWKGQALKDNEEVVLIFNDKDNKAASAKIKGPTKSSQAILSKEKIAKISLGKGKLYLVKKQKKNSQEGDRFITAAIEFYTPMIDIEVVK